MSTRYKKSKTSIYHLDLFIPILTGFMFVFLSFLFLRLILMGGLQFILLCINTLHFIEERSFDYFGVEFIQIILVLGIELFPVFFMSLNFELALIFTYFGCIGNFRQRYFHEFGKILMFLLSLFFFLELFIDTKFTLKDSIFISCHHIHKFLCVVYLWSG